MENTNHKRRKIISEEEEAIALVEMQLSGDIEYAEGGESIKFTDTGLDNAFALWFSFTPKERFTLYLLLDLFGRVAALPDTEESEDNDLKGDS